MSKNLILQTRIATLNREDVMGNMHYAQLLRQTKMLQQTSKVHEIIIGYGTFGSEVGIASRFGLPTGIKAGGIGLDIPMTKVVVADNNNQSNFANYRIHSSMIASSLEHKIPERFYESSTGGISTIKIFNIAAKQGQKIYTINQNNMNKILNKIQMSDLTRGDIISSVNTGKTVIIHERPVDIGSWHGSGYMVMDTTMYNTAWLISGGSNGGGIPDWASNSLTIIVGLGGIIAATIMFKVILVAITLALILDSYADFLNLMIERDIVSGKCIDTAVTMTGLLAILSFVGLFAPIFLSIMMTTYAYIATQIENFIIRNICPYISIVTREEAVYV